MPNSYSSLLAVKRNALNQAVDEGQPWSILEPFVNNWFQVLKQWEALDTFNTAFSEDRMTMRVTKSETPKDPPTTVKTAKWNVAQGTYEIMKEQTPTTPVYIKREHIVQRTDPTKFAIVGGKYAHGLLELPASLLNHTKMIAANIYPTTTEGWAVFMPLPMAADNALYYTLRSIEKQRQDPRAATKMREIRSELTRIKLGQNSDMHTGYVALDRNDGRPHYRYGYTGQEGLRPITFAERKARFDARMNYQSVLKLKEGASYNEVVVAYRQHRSGAFPLFALWPGLPTDEGERNRLRANPQLRLAVIDALGNPTGKFITNTGRLV